MRIFIALSIAVVAGAVGVVAYRTAVRSQAPFVAQVGSAQLDAAQVTAMQTTEARVRTATNNPRFTFDTKTWVKRQILLQEAQRRGLACTQAQAQQMLQAGYQQSLADGHPEATLIEAEASGLAPQGYSQTPEAQRTPDTQTVVQAYLNSPSVITAQQNLCSISNLGRQVNSPQVDGFATIEAGATDVVIPATFTPATGTPTP